MLRSTLGDGRIRRAREPCLPTATTFTPTMATTEPPAPAPAPTTEKPERPSAGKRPPSLNELAARLNAGKADAAAAATSSTVMNKDAHHQWPTVGAAKMVGWPVNNTDRGAGKGVGERKRAVRAQSFLCLSPLHHPGSRTPRLFILAKLPDHQCRIVLSLILFSHHDLKSFVSRFGRVIRMSLLAPMPVRPLLYAS